MSAQCRYCFEKTAPLIYPCSCKTPVHKKCLEKWLEFSNREKCEICQTPFVYKEWGLNDSVIDMFRFVVCVIGSIAFLRFFGILGQFSKILVVFSITTFSLSMVHLFFCLAILPYLPLIRPDIIVIVMLGIYLGFTFKHVQFLETHFFN